MLMHGSGLTHIVWSLHEQFYASQGYNVLSIDLPGHGSSEGPSLKSIEDMSSWVKSFMETLKIQKIIIVGHSQGCLVGIDFASKYPEFIDGLVLVAGSYKMPVNQDLIDLAEAGDDKAMSHGWFHSGDLAVTNPDGYIKIKDRSKDIIISGGENISSIEIENTLAKHPSVSIAAVVAKPDEKWGEVPCAFIEKVKDKEVTEKELISYCKETLAGFKVPKKIEFCELPKTSTGKIQKFELRKLAKELN